MLTATAAAPAHAPIARSQAWGGMMRETEWRLLDGRLRSTQVVGGGCVMSVLLGVCGWVRGWLPRCVLSVRQLCPTHANTWTPDPASRNQLLMFAASLAHPPCRVSVIQQQSPTDMYTRVGITQVSGRNTALTSPRRCTRRAAGSRWRARSRRRAAPPGRRAGSPWGRRQ